MTMVVMAVVVVIALATAWLSIARGAWSANHVAVVAALAGMGAVGRAMLGGVPSVEPVTAIVVCASIALGLRIGVSIGIASVAVSNLVLGHGPWTPWQMLGFALVALVAITAGRRNPTRARLAATAALATVAYDLLLTWGQLAMFVGDLSPDAYLRTLTLGMPYLVLHVVATVALTALAGDVLMAALDRARRRLDVRITPTAT